MRIEQSKNAKGKEIYTLVQSGLTIFDKPAQKPLVTVKGNGADLEKTEQFHKWAERKMTTQIMVRRIADIAKELGDFEFAAECWDTYFCMNSIYIANGRLYSKYGYCKNRHCTLCCCIRKAEIINKYSPYLTKTWVNAHLLTLTIKAPYLNRLNHRVDEMYKVLKTIFAKYRKLRRKGKSIKLMGIKSLEILFNPEKEWYHCHFHMVVPDRETADIIKKEWCAYWGKTFANPKCQDIRPVWDMEGALDEVIKYGNKIFTEPNKDKKLQGAANPKIYARAYYHIYKAMKGRRIFDRFGFNLPKPENPKKGMLTDLKDYKQYDFDPNSADYINEDLDFPLIGHNKDPALVYLLKYCIDTKRE